MHARWYIRSPSCYSPAVRLSLRVPAGNERGPLYMDEALAVIHQANPHRLPVTFEIGRDKDALSLSFDIPPEMRPVIESQLFAQYPECRIQPVMGETVPAGHQVWTSQLTLHPDLFPTRRFGQFEDALNRLTADHGFLLIEEGTRTAQPHGRKVDPKRRHVISRVAADHPGEVRVPLADLGYDSTEQVMFPETTAVFDTGRRPTGFVHGGNSLQERVIPVLTLVHRAAVGGSNTRYVVQATAKEAVAGMHCIEARVLAPPQGELGFGGVPALELSLRVPELSAIRVEPCQTRGGAKIVAGSIVATVGELFELFFRLSGPADTKVLIEIYHQGAEAEVVPCVLEGRFAVTAPRGTQEVTPRVASQVPGLGWLMSLPEGGVRQLFEHLAAHGAVTEDVASVMLGGPREVRRFANRFEEFAAKAPFDVRIDVIGGMKRYVREGTAS
jgi:hypothetical protein